MLILLLLFAFFIRVEDLSTWADAPEVAFVGTEPLLTNFDGYYYLGLAQDLLERTYEPVDQLRAVPDGYARPGTPPLLSWLTAHLAGITPLSLNWLAVLLPAFLGTLIVFPLYGLGTILYSKLAGVVAAFVGSSSAYFLTRTSLGWFDTDCLNATFVYLLAFLMLRFGLEAGRRRYGFLGAAAATGALFLCWWDSTPEVVALIFLGTSAIACAALYRPGRNESLGFLAAAAVLLGLLLYWKGPGFFVQVGERAIAYAEYIGKKPSGEFPSVGVAIGEQQRPSLSFVARAVAGTHLGLILSALGVAAAIRTRPRESLVLIVAGGAGLLGFFAERFLLFLAPMAALGLGIFVARLWQWARASRWKAGAAALVLIVSVSPIAYQASAKTIWPQAPPWLVAGLEQAGRVTEPDSVIWAMSEHGYGINYWARRATISDGSVHGGEHTIYNNLPLATSDPRLSSNFIRFYVTRGMHGVHRFYEAVGGPKIGFPLMLEALKSGPVEAARVLTEKLPEAPGSTVTAQEWTAFFYPEEARPVYVLVDWRMLKTAYWWYWFGTWDVTTGLGRHPRVELSPNVSITDDLVQVPGQWRVDLSTGLLEGPEMKLPLSSVVRIDDQRYREIAYDQPGIMDLLVYEPGALAVLQALEFEESMFNRLFFGPAPDERYFDLVMGKLPSFRLYRVAGDASEPRRTP